MLPKAMFSGVLLNVLLLIPVYILIAWVLYLGAKWVAALVTSSEINQAIMGLFAVVIIIGVVLSVLIEAGRQEAAS